MTPINEVMQQWWNLTALLLPFIILLFTWRKKYYNSSTDRTRKYPPSPTKLPIIGNLHQLGSYAHRSLQALAAKNGPLMLLHFGSVPILVASTADVARDIMKTHDLSFSSRPQLMVCEKLLYNKDMAFSPYGEYWRRIRKACAVHLLTARRVQSTRVVREEEVANMMAKIATAASNNVPFNLSDMLIEMTNDIICRIALGKKYSGQEEVGGGAGVRELLDELMCLLGTFNIADFIPSLSWVNRWNGFDARVEENSREIDILLERIVEEHLVHGVHGSENGGYDEVVEGGTASSSLVEVLLSVDRDSNNEYAIDRDSTKALILDMFTAGTHTTFTVIDWAMIELMRHPDTMKKLQEEAREVGKGKTMIVEDDMEHMTYLKMVVKEVLRLYPPLPLLVPRESIQDVVLQGYAIPKKTRVMINAWSIARDPGEWERSEEFWPERFISNSEVHYKGSHFQIIPFGAGRRGCPGIGFAIPTIELALANLMHGFEWNLPDGIKGEDLEMTESIGLVINRKASLVLVARPH